MKQLFATKSLEQLQAEANTATEGHGTGLKRVLGPISLTSIGVGAIIGAGIFVTTGRAAQQYAGPGIMLSYCIAGFACFLAALCYAEFAAMAPAAGSAYTYSYATLGELLAWLIGWDLVLEYAMACSTVAVGWSEYANELFFLITGTRLPPEWSAAPGTQAMMTYANIPAVLIMLVVTGILVVGVKESTIANTILVLVKLSVVLLVIAAGLFLVSSPNWASIPTVERKLPGEMAIGGIVEDVLKEKKINDPERAESLKLQAIAALKVAFVQPSHPEKAVIEAKYGEAGLPALFEKVNQERAKANKPALKISADDAELVTQIVNTARVKGEEELTDRWGLLGMVGVHKLLSGVDESVRSPFLPYGLAGIIFGASIVFFAYIGFDAVSTHAEEAVKPQTDVPIGILASLLICTALYILVAAVITGMEPYPDVNPSAAVASAFTRKGMPIVATLIAIGGLAGMTSVILISFQSQTRIFLAMARDGLIPKNVFAVIHPIFRTPHRSTLIVGTVITVTAAFTPIEQLESMVNIGTLLAFGTVCTAVLMLRLTRPDVHRPFKTPLIWVVAPLGIAFNLMLMLFLKPFTWGLLVVWIGIGLAIYFGFGYWNSTLGAKLREAGTTGTT